MQLLLPPPSNPAAHLPSHPPTLLPPTATLLPPHSVPACLQLLLYPNPSDPLNGEAAALHMRDPAAFQRKVKDYVQRFAKAEDVAALEEKEKHGGGGSGEQGEGMSEDESGEQGWVGVGGKGCWVAVVAGVGCVSGVAVRRWVAPWPALRWDADVF